MTLIANHSDATGVRRWQGWTKKLVLLAVLATAASACLGEAGTSQPPAAAAEIGSDGSVGVAEGSSWGVDWSLRGRRSEAVICLELEDGSGGTGSECALPVDASGIRFGSQQAGPQTPVFVVGQVGKRVSSVGVVLSDGQVMKADVVRVSGLPVNAYIAVLPPGSNPTGVVARNSLGLEIARSS